jgi:hypothetical protein
VITRITGMQLAAQVAGAGERPEVAQLVRVDDGPDRMDLPVGDVQHEHVDQAAGRVNEPRSGLAVDLGRPDHNADLAHLLDQAGGSGLTSHSLSVTPLGAAAIGPVFTVLHADVAQLRGAADPTAVIDPAAKIHFDSNCSGPMSCTVSNKVLVTDPDSPATQLTMIVYFAATKDGKPFATCTHKVWAAIGGVLAGVTVTPSCGLSGSAWSNWVDSHSTSFTTWAGSAFESSVNSGSDIERLQSDLDQQQGR